ncbi:mannosyltransferase [Candidatus Saccharibacteria bacterium 32-49-10]|nr:MAG: mannosyltransferase [Candidatus Saccharibacteria bacterium 32-49-10]
MKLFFDARYIRIDRHDGISRYSAELANVIANLSEVTFLICDDRQRDFLPDSSSTIKIHQPTSWREPLTALWLNQYRPDVVFSPMQTIGTTGRDYKQILTLHDLIYYRHRTPPHNLAWPIKIGWYLYHLTYWPQRLTLNAADAIVTVSQTSKRSIERVRLTKRPIFVAPNAPQPFAPIPVPETIKNLVYMGSFMEYKNVESLIRALQWLPGKTLHLLSKISPTRKAELQRLIPSGRRVVFHNGVSDEEYREILSDQAALVSASIDEGFGIPVVDALKMGVPVAVSNIEIFHEVAGEGAVFFNPHQPKQIAETIKQLDDFKLRHQKIDLGRQHAAQFDWQQSAKIVLEAAQSLI